MVALRHATHESFEAGEEVFEVEKRISVERLGVRHGAFGHETVAIHAVDHVIERTTLREAHIAVRTNGTIGAVVVGFAHNKRFAEIHIGGFQRGVLLEDFTFEESQRGISPASTRVVLVFNARHRVRHDSREHEGVFRSFLLRFSSSGGRTEEAQRREGEGKKFLHIGMIVIGDYDGKRGASPWGETCGAGR